jgi:hypothetical protein
MNNTAKYILTIFCLVLWQWCPAQTPQKAGRIQNGRFEITINPQWDTTHFEQLAGIFELDSLLTQALIRKDISFINDSTQWNATFHAGIITLSKEIAGPSGNQEDRILLSAHYDQPPGIIAVAANYGVNNFISPSSFSYADGIACFVLKGQERARSVIISGSFNQWSTMQMPMHQTDSGWVACIALPPGKHLYKYIIDGRWTHDTSNRLRERDGQRGHNSVVFCYNHTFHLQGYPNARRVVLAGSFNNFSPNELQMNKTTGGWSLTMFLREGTHAYKFIVDGNWITDPANPVTRPDGRGNINSFMNLGDPFLFTTNHFPTAGKVFLAGNFNVWNPAELAMEKVGDTWQLPYVLPPGNYEYKFIADDRWAVDSSNPFTTGSGNFTNSFIAIKPTHVFTLQGYENAREVIVTGSFNRWSHNDYRMARVNGVWQFPIHLQPGRYSYRFIVDGKWMPDPANELWERNEFGEPNSVIWVDF